MKFKGTILAILVILSGVFASEVLANNCPTSNPSTGVGCTLTNQNYFCNGSCQVNSTVPSCSIWTPSPVIAPNYATTTTTGLRGISTTACTAADACGVCTTCSGGYPNKCGNYPNIFCKANFTPTSGDAGYVTNCTDYNDCTEKCSACAGTHSLCSAQNKCTLTLSCPGQTFNVCTGLCEGAISTVKLDFDSGGINAGTTIKQSAFASPIFNISASSFVGIGSSSPSTFLSFLTSSSGLLNMGSGRIVNLSDPIDDTDAVTKGYADDLISTTVASSSFWELLGNNIYYNSGGVGIGTTTPSNKLDVEGAASFLGNIMVRNASINNTFSITNATIGANAGIANFAFNNSGSGYNTYTFKGANGRLAFENTNDGATGSFFMSYNTFQFAYNNYNVLGLTQAGKVGSLISSQNANPTWRNLLDDGSGNGYFAGNLGIGTTSPSHKLSVMGSGYFLGDNSVPNAPVDLGFYLGKSLTDENRRMEIVSPSGGAAYIDFTQPNADFKGRIIYWNSANRFEFSTNATTRMSIDGSGYVGIGTTTPSTYLSFLNSSSGLINMGNGRIVNLSDPVDDADAVTKGYADDLVASSTAAVNSVGKFVGITATKYDGNNTPEGSSNAGTGYTAANGLCNAAVSGSHVCSSAEMLNSIANNITMPVENSWVFNGPPGFTTSANDCNARTVNITSEAIPNFGTYWEGTALGYSSGRGLLRTCDKFMNYACCK